MGYGIPPTYNLLPMTYYLSLYYTLCEVVIYVVKNDGLLQN